MGFDNQEAKESKVKEVHVEKEAAPKREKQKLKAEKDFQGVSTGHQDYYDTSRPKPPDHYASKGRYEQRHRTASRKAVDYDNAFPTQKVAAEAVKFGIRLKKEAEKARDRRSRQVKD